MVHKPFIVEMKSKSLNCQIAGSNSASTLFVWLNNIFLLFKFLSSIRINNPYRIVAKLTEK